MRELAELNINEGGEPVSRQAPSENAIRAFESTFGLHLPEGLLALLRHSNGGHPELDCYDPSGVEDCNSFAIDAFFFLDDDRTSFDSIWNETHAWRRYIGANGLPFAGDGGGNILFLDLATEPPPVKVCWHDENYLVGQMAPTFEALIDGLHIPEDYI
jgi:hypothetical protein